MKRLIILFVSVVFVSVVFVLVGCTGITLPPEFCNDQGNRDDSFLLEQAAKLGMEPNQALAEIYYGMINGGQLVRIVDPESKEFLKYWLTEVGNFYEANYPTISYTQLIAYMLNADEWGEQIALISMILSTRIGQFQSGITISPWDNCALRSGWVEAHNLLLLN